MASPWGDKRAFKAWLQAVWAAARAPGNHRFFRYGFNSNEARQTVRWRRFRGLEFAPEKRANRVALQAGLRRPFAIQPACKPVSPHAMNRIAPKPAKPFDATVEKLPMGH